ncbi:MAG: D-alanyl-D-alanine carboxypeptidase [Fimbriimonadaceae bacterium]|nr:D-alanyl-D-alanine carboxypeptidase [Fimbriimonadaceae bacterium]
MVRRSLLTLVLLATVARTFAGATSPTVTAQSAIAIDAESGRVLWEKDADTIRYPASTTKILTALLVLERLPLDEVLTAPKEVEGVGGSSLYMLPGERLTVRDALYAILLRSANDVCVTVACRISGSVDKFAELMNERAKSIGCEHTHFHNPHGLNDAEHTTTARDLALIAREAMKHPLFAKIVRTPKFEISRPTVPQDQVLVSKNKWIRDDPTADGIKTGYTEPAGKCFVGSATREGFRVITVVLKSENWEVDTANLMAWTYARHERRALVQAGDPLGSAQGRQWEASSDLWKTVPETTTVSEIELAPGTAGPVAVVHCSDGFKYVLDGVVPSSTVASTQAGTLSPVTWFLVAILAGGAWMMNRRSRRMIGGATIRFR